MQKKERSPADGRGKVVDDRPKIWGGQLTVGEEGPIGKEKKTN